MLSQPEARAAKAQRHRGHDRDHCSASRTLVEDHARRVVGTGESLYTLICIRPVREDVRWRLLEASEEVVDRAGQLSAFVV